MICNVWFGISRGHATALPPIFLSIIEPLLESIYYDLVNSLDLSIPLGISWGRIPIRNFQVTTVSPERFVIKLKAIVRDEGTRDLPCDNIFPNEFLGIYVPDICQGLYFNSLSKVVCANQQISLVPHCLGEGANNV